MENISVNKNVYDAVKYAANDYVGKNDISKSELQTIEKEMAKDGKIDDGEKALLNALRDGTSFTLNVKDAPPSSDTAEILIDPSKVTFPDDMKELATYDSLKVKAGSKVGYANDTLVSLDGMIPKQQAGAKTDNYAKKTYGSEEDAKAAFASAKAKLFNPSTWEATAGAGAKHVNTSASFQLRRNGQDIDGPPQVGDWIKIRLPGSPNADWVKVAGINDTPDKLEIKVQCDPDNKGEHWYKNSTTNTFVLERKGNDVTFSVHGRNEVSNSNPYDYLKEKTAKWTGLQDDQWQDLGRGLLGSGTSTGTSPL